MELKQKINLQYFAEDTAAAETAANTVTGAEEVQDAAEQTGETAENNSEENTRVAAEGNNDKAQGNASDYLSAILELPEEKKSDLFGSLLKSDAGFKSNVDSYAQNAVIGRLSDVKKQYKQESDKLNKLVSAAKQIYGTDDVDKISDLLLSDDRLYEDEAFKRGVDVSVIKQEKILERREQALNERELAQQHENEFIELDKKWREEAEGLMPVYPNFDFDAVMSDEEKGAEMLDFLMQGISLKKAYEITHIDEIMENAKKFAAEQAKKSTVDAIKARGLRPAENGVGSQAPAEPKFDIANMSDEQREDIIKRAQRGEIIRF